MGVFHFFLIEQIVPNRATHHIFKKAKDCSSFNKFFQWSSQPETSQKSLKYLDLLWMIDLCIAKSVISVWVGCNSILSAGITEVIQKIWYLPQINEAPTSTAAVAETLNIAQRIASECKKELLYVT